MQTASTAVPILPALIMGALWIIIAFVSYSSTQRRYGRGDLPASCAVSGLVVCSVGMIMSLIPNFMPSNPIMNPLIYSVVIEIIFAFWFFTSKE